MTERERRLPKPRERSDIVEGAPHPGALRDIARRLASEGKVEFAYHADEERMPERDFDTQDVFETIRIGEVHGPVLPGRYPGEWVIKICAQPFGAKRWMGVVTVVIKNEKILIATTEWEDHK